MKNHPPVPRLPFPGNSGYRKKRAYSSCNAKEEPSGFLAYKASNQYGAEGFQRAIGKPFGRARRRETLRACKIHGAKCFIHFLSIFPSSAGPFPERMDMPSPWHTKTLREGPTMIYMKDVSKLYPVGEKVVAALSHVSLHIAPGEYTAIVGPAAPEKAP